MSKKVLSPVSTSPLPAPKYSAPAPVILSPVATASIPTIKCSTPPRALEDGEQLLKNFYYRQTTEGQNDIVGGATNHDLGLRTKCASEEECCPIIFDGPCCLSTPAPSLSAGTSSVTLGDVVFSNSNSVSFGLSGRTVTASFAGGGSGGAPFAISASGSSVSSGTVVFSNANSFSFGMVGSTITASYIPGSGSQTVQPGIQSISGGTTRVTTGEVVFSNSNGLSFGVNGQTITGSYTVPVQSTQTENCVDLSFAGNTSGALALISSGTAIFAGGNNITLSQNGQSVTISAANFSQTVQTQNVVDVSLSGNTSGALALISSGTAIFAGGNNITLSQNGQSITISAANSSQTVQTQNLVDVSLSGNTSGVLALISSGTAIFAGGNNITLSQNGQSITISAFNQTVQTQNLIDATLAGNTSGTLALISSGTLTLAGGNNITLSQAGNAVTISGVNTAAQTNQTLGLYAVSNTTQGTSGIDDARSLSFAGAGVASVGVTNGSVVISVPGAAGDGGNVLAAGTQTANTTGTVLFQNSNGITFGMSNSSVITASYTVPTIPAAGSISAGTTSATLGQVIFSNSNSISFGMDAGTVTATVSYPAQTVQTQNLIDLSLSGNTSGTLALISSGTAILAGGNNITLSQDGQSVTISAVNQTVQTQNVVDVTLSGNTTGTLALVSSGTLTLAGGNNITLSQSGNKITISGPNTVAQTVQTQNCVDMSLSGNTSGTLALISSDTAIFAGGNNITLSQDGQSVTISAFNQTVQTQNLIDVTLDGNTTGTLALISSGTLTLAGGDNITLSQNGNAVTISGPNAVSQTVQTQNCVDLSLAGNTSGTLTLISSGTAILAGGNNITLSQNGQSITISAPPTLSQSYGFQDAKQSVSASFSGRQLGLNLFASQAIFFNTGVGFLNDISLSINAPVIMMGVSSQGNTSGATGLVGGSSRQFLNVVFVGGNNITLSQSWNSSTIANASALATITISAANQTIQTQFCINMSIGGNTSGTKTLISSGTAVLAGGNNITLSQSGQSITISAFNQTVQTQNCVDLSLAGNTSGTLTIISSGTGILAGGNNITLSQDGQSVTISAFNQTNQTLGLYMSSNTTSSVSSGTVDARSMTFRGVGNVSVGYSNGEVILSGATAATAIAFSAGASSANLSSLIFSNSNNISFGLSGSTVTASASAQSVQTQNCVDLSIGGNTSGTSTIISSGTAILLGGNNITLSQSGQSITISAFNQTVQTQNCVDVSLAGNTSGTLTIVSSGTAILAGGNNITLSQDGQSVTISAFNQTVQTQNCVDLSIGGNTSGTSTIVSSGTAILLGGNNITLSQNGQSITISAFSSNPGTLSLYQNIPSMVNMVTGLSAITVTSGSSIFVQPFVLPNYQSIGYVRLLASLNDSAVGTGGTTSLNTTASVERYTTIAIVIYSQGVGASSNSIQSLASTSVGITGRTIFSMGNGGGASSYTLTLQKTYPNTGAANVNYTTSYNVNSGSIVISSNSNTLFTGPQFIDIPFATSLTPGNYWLGIGASTSSNSNSALISFAGTCAMPISLAAISQSNVSVGLMGQATSASQYQLQLGLGLWTTNASVISTGSIGLNSISQLVSNRQIPFQFIRQA